MIDKVKAFFKKSAKWLFLLYLIKGIAWLVVIFLSYYFGVNIFDDYIGGVSK